MDLRLSELQQLIQDNAEEFLEREVPARRARDIEWAGKPDEQLWKQMVDLGWTGLPIADAHGGQGGTLVDFGVLLERCCRHALLSPLAATTLAACTVQRHGSDELRRQLLPRVGQGATVAPALKEGSGALRAPLATTYADGKVRGEKRFVDYGETSDYHLVAAQRNGSTGLALVPRAQAGVRTLPLKTMGGTPQAVATYDNAASEGWIDGAEAVEYMRLLGGAISALECYAHAQQALDMTVEYVQIRVAFGRPIGTFEAVQQRIADMATLVTAARFLAYEGLHHFDEGRADPVQIAATKAVTARAVTEVTNWAHVLHGGVGFMAEYDLQLNTRQGKQAALRWGDPREATGVVADAVLA